MMTNVFRRLIKREFGHPLYYRFFVFLREKIQEGKIDSFDEDEKEICNDDIYHEMYDILKDKDNTVLEIMQKRLSDTMLNAMGICKSYLVVVLMYCFALLIMIGMMRNIQMLFAGMGLLTAIFLYKTFEFVSNKFCFIDAHIVIIYKCVLDKLLTSCNDNE